MHSVFFRLVLIRADSHWVGQCHAGSHDERSSRIFDTKDVRHMSYSSHRLPSLLLYRMSLDKSLWCSTSSSVCLPTDYSAGFFLFMLLNPFMVMSCTNSSTFPIDMSSTTTRGTPTIQRIFQATMAISSLPVSHSLRCFLVSYLYFRY